jgi:hypothetical protein
MTLYHSVDLEICCAQQLDVCMDADGRCQSLASLGSHSDLSRQFMCEITTKLSREADRLFVWCDTHTM